MSTTANQNKPSGYINISASIKSTFTCCITSNKDIQNNKVNSKDIETNEIQEREIAEDTTINVEESVDNL